jgi:integrase
MGARNRDGIRIERRGSREILVIDFRYRDKDGREARFRRDASVQTKTAARAEADRLRRRAVEHGSAEASPAAVTLERFVRDDFEPLVMKPKYSPATRERYGRVLTQHGIIEVLGRTRIDEIGAREFRELEAFICKRGSSPRQHLILLRRILATAHEHGAIATMPALPKVERQSRKLTSAPSRDVVEQCLDGSSGWLRTAIALAYYGTNRNGEARASRIGDVDLRKGVLHIRRALSNEEVWSTKGDAERDIPIALPLRAILGEAIRDRDPSELLMADEQGRIPTRQKLYKCFVALQKRLGITPTWSFHSLRHAFGSETVRGGANIKAVQELMGHRDLETTSLYIHALDGDRTAAVATLERATGGKRPEGASRK